MRSGGYLDSFQVDGCRDSPVRGVVLLGIRLDHEDLAPGLSVGVELHHLGEADELVLVERARVGGFESVVHSQCCSTTVVDKPCMAGRLA